MTWGNHVSAIVVLALTMLVLASTAYYVFGGARDPRAAPFDTAQLGSTQGDPDAGRSALTNLGCTSCHTVAGVPALGGRVGPTLDDLHDRRLIAGRLPNTPENAVRFILDPQGVSPGSAMPDLRVAETQARDIVAYLYGPGGR